MKTILLTGSLRSPPFGGCATTFPPQAGALQTVLNLESLMKNSLTELCSATACGGSPAKRARGNAFPTPAGRLYGFPTGEARLSGFSRHRRHKKWRPKGRRTSPAQRYYITPEGGALNPPVRRSRSQAEPLAPRAKGPAAPSTLAAKPRQPTGIQESTAHVPVPTAPKALVPIITASACDV